MSGEKSITALLRGMSPKLNPGEYVFCTVADSAVLQGSEVLAASASRKG